MSGQRLRSVKCAVRGRPTACQTCGFTSLSWFVNNRNKMDASHCNRVNRALLGRRLYSCQVGTLASTILPSATSCKRAQTSSVFEWGQLAGECRTVKWVGRWLCKSWDMHWCSASTVQQWSVSEFVWAGVSSLLNRNHEVETKSSVQMKRKRRLCFSVSWRHLVMGRCLLGETAVWL